MSVVGYRPFSLEVAADPYPYYEELREVAPVHHLERDDVWVVSRYDDVVAVLRDPLTFSSALGLGDVFMGRARIPGRRPPSFLTDFAGLRVLIASDPPDHTRLRRLVSKAFTPREIAALESRIRALAESMVDDLIDAGDDGDLVAQLAYPLPVIVIADLLGIPGERRDDFKGWSDDLVGGLSGTWDPERLQVSGAEMFTYFAAEVADRKRRPGDDLISLLATRAVEDGSALEPMEILMFCVLLLVAGNETTTNLIGNGAQALFEHPGEGARLHDDPELVAMAVEEALRYDAPVQSLPRGTTRDVEIGGARIPAGAHVLVLFGSANRDERRYPDADVFRADRNPADHMAFGAGIHHCLGAPLARLEARAVGDTMVRRLRALEPTGDATRIDSFFLRGFAHMPVRAVPR